MIDPYRTAEEFKAAGIARQESWSRWVQRTSLRPGMDAKDWYAIYDSVSAVAPAKTHIDISPTHYDEMFQCDVEIVKDDRGVFMMRWANGMIGSNPPFYPPDPQRFTRRPNTASSATAPCAPAAEAGLPEPARRLMPNG